MTREELIKSLTLLKEQAHNSGANTFVWDINIDSFNFVIDSTIKALKQEPTTKKDITENCIACKYDEDDDKAERCKKCLAGDDQFEPDDALIESITKSDFLSTITEKIVEQVTETHEEFIFETIRPYCENVVQTKISKRDLEQALLKYYGKSDIPSVTPQEPRKGYLSIDDVMSVFDDFMCGEVDEDGTETFLEMLKDKAETEAE